MKKSKRGKHYHQCMAGLQTVKEERASVKSKVAETASMREQERREEENKA